MTAHDPRLTPARPDLASAHLRGVIEAQRYVTPQLCRIVAPSAVVRREPVPDAPLDTEALAGEPVAVLDENEGWVWAQLLRDGYVGYLPTEAVSASAPAPTHVVTVLRSFVFPGPSIKQPPLAALPYAAEVAVAKEGPEPFVQLAGGGYVIARHLALAPGWRDADYVATAERFVGVPYLWGGKTSLGIDCSGLVQVALRAAGVNFPRDAYRQEASPAAKLVPGSERQAGLKRGDLVFWKGHVGLMLDETRLIHANAYHMLVAVEPLAEAAERILARGGGPITSVRRLRD
jgi:cell wall-associated NlpC family hydrolase